VFNFGLSDGSQRVNVKSRIRDVVASSLVIEEQSFVQKCKLITRFATEHRLT
jgi:hypothetical protein